MLVLAAFVSWGHSSASAAWQQDQAAKAGTTHAAWTTDQPLTGRAIPCENGRLKIYECRNVEVLSYLPSSAMGGAGGNTVWGWTDSATGREFVIVSGGEVTAFVEVTDPLNPKYLGTLAHHDGLVGGPDVKVYKDHAFITIEGVEAGMQVFDLAQLRDVKTPPVEFQETAHYANFGNAHTLTMNAEAGFAFPTGIRSGDETCGGGLHMVDVRTPTKPTFAGCYAHDEEGGLMGPGYVHEALCTNYRGPDQQYKGREICLNSSGSSVVIVDVTDKQQPKTISVATYPNVGYAHQGWFTDDQRYFFLGDELDEINGSTATTRTIGFDLTDLDDPVVLTEYLATTPSTDHNLYIRGRYMYQSNYTAGLRIVDIADPKNPREVGYLDTDPHSDDTGMTGSPPAWSNYPFLKNDVVALSAGGLFLVRLQSR